MVIINTATYNKIVEFLSTFQGLSVECELELEKDFPSLSADTLRSLVSKQGQNLLKLLFYKYTSRSDAIIAA